MSELIYLVGQISPKFEETYKWRKTIEDKFCVRRDIKFINPCNNPFNKKILKEKEYAVTAEKRTFGIDVLSSKDYTYCKRSTGAIANLNQYDPLKPLIGSFFELAWYFTMPEKTVIGFSEDPNSYICQHPFVQKAITTWVKDEHEACFVLNEYFSATEEGNI